MVLSLAKDFKWFSPDISIDTHCKTINQNVGDQVFQVVSGTDGTWHWYQVIPIADAVHIESLTQKR